MSTPLPKETLEDAIPLFHGLTPEQLAHAHDGLTVRSYERWEMIVSQSDATQDVFFLIEGALLAMFYTEDGREVIFTQINPGEYFGELSALDGGLRSLAVLAKSPVTLAVMPAKAFVELIDTVPQVRGRVLRDLVARVRALTHRTLALTTFSVKQRLVSYVASLAIDRKQFRAGGIIDDAPTHAEISATIGTNREMITRVMSRLSREGILRTTRKRIEILDPLRLEVVSS